jgi:hypothetical protein
MSQANDSRSGNDPSQEEVDAPATEDIGGVQGTAPEDSIDSDGGAPMSPGGPADRQTPDAGEIEWAGQVVKKPPTPNA